MAPALTTPSVPKPHHSPALKHSPALLLQIELLYSLLLGSLSLTSYEREERKYISYNPLVLTITAYDALSCIERRWEIGYVYGPVRIFGYYYVYDAVIRDGDFGTNSFND